MGSPFRTGNTELVKQTPNNVPNSSQQYGATVQYVSHVPTGTCSCKRSLLRLSFPKQIMIISNHSCSFWEGI